MMLAHQALKFLITGVFNTLVGYSLYAVFLFAGLNYGAALAAATILGVLFNFKTIGAFVFKSHDNSLIFKFIFIYLITFCINLGLIRLLVSMGINAYMAGLIVIIPLSVISFLLNKYFVFKR